MNDKLFKTSIAVVVIIFTFLFVFIVIPPLIENPDIIGAFGAGFVNPYASGYSVDVFCCWFILIIWIIYESPKVKYGWICAILGIVPGVAVGFGLYLIIRAKQMSTLEK